MKELGITKGEWQYRDHFSDGIIETEETIIGHLMKWGSPEDELQSNAVLIIDAGNTLQKCGLLPSELLQQRDELKEALERIANPIAYMERNLKEGERLNGMMAIQISNNAEYLKGIADAAIKKTESLTQKTEGGGE